MSIQSLPKSWQISTVASLCKMQNGHSFGPNDWDVTGLPIIRIQNLNGGKEFDYFSGIPDPRWIVEPGQLLFSWAGTKGVSFGPFIWRGPRGVLNQHIFKVLASENISKEWLYWALKDVTSRIEAQAHGFKATLVHVKKSDIERQQLLVPTGAEQRYIAQALSTWEQAIAISEVMLSNSKKQRQMIVHLLTSGKLQLADFQNSAEKFKTAHGSIPSNWSYPNIGEIAVEVSQKLRDGEPLPVLSCTKYTGLVDSLSYFKKQVFSKDISTYKVVSRDCFVYATNHIEEGSIGYQDLYEKAIVSPMYTVFKTHGEIDDGYLYQLLKTEKYRQIFSAATNASVDRRGSLRWKEFKKIHVPLPPLAEQRAAISVFDTFYSEVTNLEKQLVTLKAEKNALMTILLTGKRRLTRNSLPHVEAST
ncbi:restriction endonuclease subunit S [Janthinobacterium sp.]|uniref:restriction endonuclease subunit S n=1 Tax=Janthinobacterium sp. TaxID=1871054 RepID=UPI0025B80898|nr:restriction endonuclease subunit S [Janthinobacterium sp.]